MSTFLNCQDARDRKTIMEIDCPQCHGEEEIEVFLKDSATVEESICSTCGYVIPEGTHFTLS